MMTDKKKWLVILRKDQYDWIKETAQSTELKGSDIVRAMIDETMKTNPEKFKQKLAEEQTRIELQSYNDKISELHAKIEAKKKELKQRTVQEKVYA